MIALNSKNRKNLSNNINYSRQFLNGTQDVEQTPGGVSPTLPPKQKGGSNSQDLYLNNAHRIFDDAVTNSPSAVKYFGEDTPMVENTANTNTNTGRDYKTQARLTMYNGADDKYGSQTAYPNIYGKNQALPGITVAVDPSVIKPGSFVHIPGTEHLSAHGDGVWHAGDTGSGVSAKTASGGQTPVIDVYAPNHNLNDPIYNKNFNYAVVQPPVWAKNM